MIIKANTDKSIVNKVRKQIKKNNHACPYFLEKEGKSVPCFCQDIIDAPEGTYCYTGLYKKESENK